MDETSKWNCTLEIPPRTHPRSALRMLATFASAQVQAMDSDMMGDNQRNLTVSVRASPHGGVELSFDFEADK
jgi:hypothetical protein